MKEAVRQWTLGWTEADGEERLRQRAALAYVNAYDRLGATRYALSILQKDGGLGIVELWRDQTFSVGVPRENIRAIEVLCQQDIDGVRLWMRDSNFLNISLKRNFIEMKKEVLLGLGWDDFASMAKSDLEKMDIAFQKVESLIAEK